MVRYSIRRLLQTVIVVFIVTVLAFSVTMLLPGDPARAILGVQGAENEGAYLALRQQLGLDQPVPVQYLNWLGRVVRGDFGNSAINQQPVVDALKQRLPVTLELGVLSLLFSTLVAVPLGVYAALRRDTVADVITSVFSLAGVAMPSFWLGILMIMALTVSLGWLPASGYVPFAEDPMAHVKLMIMPVFVLSAESVGGLQRQVRSAMLEVLNQDYIRTSRAKGLRERIVVGSHGLRNALIPVVTFIGLRVARLLGGAVAVESVFALPGIGRLAVESIFNRDFPVTQSIVLVAALMVLLSNLATDLLYGYLDPRIRYG